MNHKVTWDRGANYEDVVEAVRRVFVRDGVPRHVYDSGKIMKYDWMVSSELLEDNLEGVELEAHIQNVIEQAEVQDGQQG